jgi:hypothetical protein
MSFEYAQLRGCTETRQTIQKPDVYRPVSRSDSFTHSPANRTRAALFPLGLQWQQSQQSQLPLLPHSPTSYVHDFSLNQVQRQHHIREVIIEPTPPSCPHRIIVQGLRYSFHITLISVFETVFFFLYVSKLEDDGINNTIQYFVDGALQSCSNLSQEDTQILNVRIDPLVNITNVRNDAIQTQLSREAHNSVLLTQSWFYVGGFGGIFLILVFTALMSKIQIKWGKLIVENLLFVSILAAYEFMFFKTIINPYNPVSGPEITWDTIQRFSQSCGLFNLTNHS